ncbi:RHS repeat-associated core domain-containing protein [Chryseobacterium sp.]|uniref:RHS repeat-associated core domain-containing protein n=1 Tax=Chryseobacterium sp. TaxID=1871047 RepID=UPI0024E1ED43|nr:RHS repeat-associated core domain-containing protein [Chryseobacterium sp.]
MLNSVSIFISFGRNSAGALEITDANDYYPFGMNHLKTGNAFYGQGSYKNYKYQEQELQETGFYSFKWRNYMPDVGRFFNVDPLAEKYPTWAPYVFSGNRVVDARELEGLEPVEINKTTKNLVIVNQGWIRANPPDGATQAQNFGKVNKDGGIDYSGIGIINNLNSSTTQVGVFGSSNTENTKNDILSSIQSFRKQSPDGKLIMVGHSRGADNLIELVNEHTEVKVDLLFTLDIADDYDDDNIPSNVKTAVNYYNKNDGVMGSSIGGEDIEANDPSKTKILNVPVSASHTEIDNKYRYNAYNAVVNELNKKKDKKQ